MHSLKEKKEFKFQVSSPGMRLDVFLHKKLKELARAKVKKLIKEARVKVNNKVVIKPAYKLKAKDLITAIVQIPERLTIPAWDIPVQIIYEDEDIIVVNKPPDMLTHPTSIDRTNTLVNALVYRFNQLSDLAGALKPGIVHRLDKDTSGIILIAKNNYAHSKLAEQFKNRTIEKKYLAVVEGRVGYDEGVINQPIARGHFERKKMRIDYSRGKPAETYFKVLARLHNYTFLVLHPKTGRTHQLRVHMKHYGHPILGDSKYGRKSELIKRQALHAYSMRIKHPRTNEELYFKAGLPDDFKKVLEKIARQNFHQLLNTL